MAEERDLIDFETEYVLAEVFPDRIDAPDSLRRCSYCGAGSAALPASELTVIKHRAVNQPLGHMMLYCHAHLVAAKDWEAGTAHGGRLGPVCPNCHMTVPSGSGECDNCGWTPSP